MIPAMLRRLRRLLLALLASGLLMNSPALFAETAAEAQLKASYLINFLKYVEWPGQHASLTICLLGRDTLLPDLKPHEGQLVAGKTLHIRYINGIEGLADCQVLFVPASEEKRLGNYVRQAEKQAVLIVGETDKLLRNGGDIALTPANGKMVFDINLDAMDRAGLKPASQLLRMAREVRGTVK